MKRAGKIGGRGKDEKRREERKDRRRKAIKREETGRKRR